MDPALGLVMDLEEQMRRWIEENEFFQSESGRWYYKSKHQGVATAAVLRRIADWLDEKNGEAKNGEALR